MDGGFNGVNAIEGVFGEGHLLSEVRTLLENRAGNESHHEITLYELQLVCKAFFLRISCGTLNLIVIVVQSSDVCAGEFGNFSRRTSNTASHIKDSVSIFDTNFGSEVVFVTGNGLVEGFSVGETTEME